MAMRDHQSVDGVQELGDFLLKTPKTLSWEVKKASIARKFFLMTPR
jgi:hypothetical protein